MLDNVGLLKSVRHTRDIEEHKQGQAICSRTPKLLDLAMAGPILGASWGKHETCYFELNLAIVDKKFG